MSNLPEGTLERLSLYKQTMIKYIYLDKAHILSSDLARILDLSPEQVRRDLMLIECNSTSKRAGYSVPEIINKIDAILYPKGSIKAIIIGPPPFKQEFYEYFDYSDKTIEFIAMFSMNPDKYNTNIPSYKFEELADFITAHNPPLAIINTSTETASYVFPILCDCGIRAIFNLSVGRLQSTENTVVQNLNLPSQIEKLLGKIDLD